MQADTYFLDKHYSKKTKRFELSQENTIQYDACKTYDKLRSSSPNLIRFAARI